MTRSLLEREAGLRSCCRRGRYRPTTRPSEKGLGAPQIMRRRLNLNDLDAGPRRCGLLRCNGCRRRAQKLIDGLIEQIMTRATVALHTYT